MKIPFVLLLAALVAGCADPLSAEQEQRVAQTVNAAFVERDPLCVEIDKLPYRSDRGRTCDRCQELLAAGLVTRRIVDTPDQHYIEYLLSQRGAAVYQEERDPELYRPRMCFGATRFHRVTDALSPIWFGGQKTFSVKLTLEAKDTSGHLFDPEVQALGIPVPSSPEADQPLLYPPQVWTFVENSDGSLTPSDMRYGRWVDEE